MSQFQYRALQSDGAIAEGALEAPGRQEAMRLLEGRGLRPIGLTEAGGGPGLQTRHVGQESPTQPVARKKLPFRVVENFTRQLSSLLIAGIPLARALRILAKEAASPVAGQTWRAIHDRVADGAALADALGGFPESFPRVYVAMVQAGESGGFLDVVLGQIADFQLRERELRSRLLSAMIYPAVLLCLAIAVLTFLLMFFIPRFQAIFEGFHAQLPMITRIVLAASHIAKTYGILVVLAIVVGWILARRTLETERGRRAWETLVLRMPVLGSLSARFGMTRFCRMLGTLVGAGVPLVGALHVARRSLGNQILVDAVTNSIDRVKEGESLASSLADCRNLFPGSVVEMISVAEETGRLDSELVRIAAVSDSDLDRQLRMAVALAEPLMLFLLAGFIGTIFVGMVLPIFSLQEYIK